MPTIECEAICVRHWDWSETSQTVSLLTQEHGLLRCLAKGSKREKAPFSGGLELATLGYMVGIDRPNSELTLLTSWDLLDPMYLLRADLNRYHAAMYAIDLVPRLINDQDPHPGLFEALRLVLTNLGDDPICAQDDLARLLVYFQWVLLTVIGSRPELRLDVQTGEDIEKSGDVFGFDARQGGVTLDPGSSEQAELWRVRRSTIELLRRLDEIPELAGLESASPGELDRSGALLAAYIRTLLGYEVRSAHPIYPQIRRGL